MLSPEGRIPDLLPLVHRRQYFVLHAARQTGKTAPLYPETVAHLALMAFLQRVVDGGGQVQREFAAGRGAVDLVVHFGGERFVVEIKRGGASVATHWSASARRAKPSSGVTSRASARPRAGCSSSTSAPAAPGTSACGWRTSSTRGGPSTSWGG